MAVREGDHGEESKDKEQGPEHFEEQLEKLKGIVEQIEHGGLNLNESLKLFEEGIGLSRRLLEILNRSEGRVEELLATMEKAPFERERE